MTRRSPFHQAPSRTGGTGSSHARRPLLTALAAAGLMSLGAGGALAGAPASVDPNPRHLVDDEGTTIDMAGIPERVISLSPANTEIVYALGAADRLVGATDFDDYPLEAAALPDVATYQGVLMEQVVNLRPDLVLAAGNFFTPPDDITRMRELGYPVVVVYAASVEGVLADVELIGDALGAGDAADALAADMQADLDAVADALEAAPDRPRTFYQIGSEPDLYGPAPESFLEDLIVLAGGDPITTGDPNVFSISLEALVAADPEVIVVGDAQYGVCPVDVMARPGWGSMTAVVERAVRPVNDTVVTRPGPRLPDGLASLARAIHPELELSGFAADPPICDAAGSPAPTAGESAAP